MRTFTVAGLAAVLLAASSSACTRQDAVTLYVHEPVTPAQVRTLMQQHRSRARVVHLTTYYYDEHRAYHETGEYAWDAGSDWRRIR